MSFMEPIHSCLLRQPLSDRSVYWDREGECLYCGACGDRLQDGQVDDTREDAGWDPRESDGITIHEMDEPELGTTYTIYGVRLPNRAPDRSTESIIVRIKLYNDKVHMDTYDFALSACRFMVPYGYHQWFVMPPSIIRYGLGILLTRNTREIWTLKQVRGIWKRSKKDAHSIDEIGSQLSNMTVRKDRRWR